MNAKKIVAALLAAVLLIGIGVGGTLAWLMDYTMEVQNTFTVGDINIDLQETVYNPSTGKNDTLSAKTNNVGNNQFKIIPGTQQTKDPKVIVAAGSEDCYVFVQITAVNTTVENLTYKVGTGETTENVTFVQWAIADGWTKLDGVDNVYYREYTSGEKETYSVLADDQVSYSENLTKAQIDAFLKLFEEPSQAKPSLTFKAYAVQKEAATTAAAAWAIAIA